MGFRTSVKRVRLLFLLNLRLLVNTFVYLFSRDDHAIKAIPDTAIIKALTGWLVNRLMSEPERVTIPSMSCKRVICLHLLDK